MVCGLCRVLDPTRGFSSCSDDSMRLQHMDHVYALQSLKRARTEFGVFALRLKHEVQA